MPNSELKATVPIDITEEMKHSYLDYAMSVIVSRALPDVRDGLKPVHRRILYSMYESGYYYNRQHRKSARIVGDVIGKYHPHGDVAIYDSLARMAQDFSLRIPLIDGQGNFGSVDGDAPAAMRYTEARLAKITHTLLNNIGYETVDFQENYDGTEKEPKVLPALLPNLLVNGAGGIAVGMATNIPPHNLVDVIQACCLYVDNPEISIDELINVVQGPDFPTKGIIIGTTNLYQAYTTGRGIITIRGKADIEEIGQKQQIIISEIPYLINKAKLVEKIAELVKDKKIEGISDLRDESDKSGIRVVIELKRDAIAEVTLKQLYTYTPMQTSFGINMLALDKGIPKLLNLKEIIAAFIKFRQEVIYRRTVYFLEQSKQKAHILLGLYIAVSNIDRIINIIRNSADPASAKEQLKTIAWSVSEITNFPQLLDSMDQDKNGYYFTEQQIKAILEMRLQRLTNLEKNKIQNELEELVSNINEYLSIINSPQTLLTLLKQELIELKTDFATPRLTSIEATDKTTSDVEELIAREEMVTTVTLAGYIKRVPLKIYHAQKRGGKGRLALSMSEDDIITKMFVANTHTSLLFFSNLGQVYQLKLYKLPLSTPQAKGRPIINLLPLKSNELITNIMPLPENSEDWSKLNIIFATKKGQVRRNELSDFKYIPSNGKIAIRLDDDDQLISVQSCDTDEQILLATVKGKCIRFPVEAVRIFKSRSSDGVRGIELGQTDQVIAMTILRGIDYPIEQREAYLSIPLEFRKLIAQNQYNAITTDIIKKELEKKNVSLELIEKMAKQEQFILSITANGYGKCTSCYEYRITNRGGKGIINITISAKTGNVVGVIPTNFKDEELMLITNSGKLIRFHLNKIRATGRQTSGVILVKTEQNEHVASASLIADKLDI